MKTLTATIALALALTGTSAYSQDRMSKAEALERSFNRMADLFARPHERRRFGSERSIEEFNDARTQERRHREMVDAILNSGTCHGNFYGCRRR
jgi:ribonucleotide reductase alpha subunit